MITEKEIGRLLRQVTGLEIIKNYRFDWLLTIPNLNGSTNRIFNILCKKRGHSNFIKTQKLNRGNDFYIPMPYNCIFEFDEYQHFTPLRELSLKQYDNIPVFFNGIEGTEGYLKDPAITFTKNDPSPIYRDEQRAYYDSLRDILPLSNGLNPTMRLSKHKIAKLPIEETCNLMVKLLGEYKHKFKIRNNL